MNLFTLNENGKPIININEKEELNFLGVALPLITFFKEGKAKKPQYNRKCGNVECKYNKIGDSKRVRQICSDCGTSFCNIECLKASMKQKHHYCYCKINKYKHQLYKQLVGGQISSIDFINGCKIPPNTLKYDELILNVCIKMKLTEEELKKYYNLFNPYIFAITCSGSSSGADCMIINPNPTKLIKEEADYIPFYEDSYEDYAECD